MLLLLVTLVLLVLLLKLVLQHVGTDRARNGTPHGAKSPSSCSVRRPACGPTTEQRRTEAALVLLRAAGPGGILAGVVALRRLWRVAAVGRVAAAGLAVSAVLLLGRIG